MRLIDADELKKELTRHEPIIRFNRNYDGLLADIIDNAPTIVVTTKLQFKERNNENGKLQRRKG